MKKFVFLTFSFCLPLLSLFSSSFDVERVSEKLINQILSKAPNSVERVDDQRLYLKSECLSIKNARILLEDPNGYKLELPNLSSYECTNCHEQYGGHPGVCDRCGRSSFIRKYVPIPNRN